MIKLKPSTIVRRVIYGIVAISLITGISFFVLNNWITVEGDFGPEKHPWQFPILKIHAASAFAMMILYGMLWASHIQFGWRTRRSRSSGSWIVGIVGLQVLSAYLLYYLANETLRAITVWIHLASGTLLPMILIIHTSAVRRHRRLEKKHA